MTANMPPDRPANVDPHDDADQREGVDQRDTAATLDALQRACADSSLNAPLRALLLRARNALRVADMSAEAAQQRYRALFDAVPDPVSVLDENGIVLDLNKAGMAAYKLPLTQIVGQPIERLNPDLPKDHLIPVWETLNRGETYVIEVTNKRSDGTRFPVEVHSAGFMQDGKRCIVAVARDLSARWHAESRYRLLMESIDKGVILFDRNLEVVSANPSAHRMLGISRGIPGLVKGGEWIIVDEHGQPMSPDDWPTTRALRSGQSIGSTLIGLYHKPSSRMTWISADNVPVFSPDCDQADHVFAMFSDVTSLKRDNALFDRVQSLAHIGGWEWDAGCGKLYLTDEASHILGQPQSPATLDDMLACMCEPDRARLRAAIDDLGADAGGFTLEVQGLRADGRDFWARVIGQGDHGDPATRITGTLQDITERKRAEDVLRIQARTDPLTGLMNRDALLGELGAMLGDPARAELAVLYIDLDRFKTINDVFGHAAGDELLINAAQRIHGAISGEGSIARFGGDEFLAVCATGDDPERPQRLAERVLASFAPSFEFGNDEFAITASIGIARTPTDGLRPQELIQNADAAMYDSKRRTRNGWQAFTPDLAQRQHDRLQIETQLRCAADNGEFHLVYQPQVDLRDGRIVAAEALIRWDSHQLGELRPDIFISHAENTGDIVRIGAWVLREACRQVDAWRQQGHGIVRVAINVSYRQFLAEDLVRRVREALDEFALPGSALELEFTERVLIEDSADTILALEKLRTMGVLLAIDDFGEGYSALNYLRRLPIHGLKLSQLFVGGVPGNPSDVAVCRAVSAIASSLGLGLVAEGVESELQRQFLLQIGVPVGQGFLFAPGLSPYEFAMRLELAHKDEAGKSGTHESGAQEATVHVR
ncbi:MAG: EAL domain-containing protein [Pseudomonadota bacterium]|nr:EAL domain-containing protein [Pseudomonadota bacterium]